MLKWSETWGCILKFRFNMFYFVFTFRINTELFGGRQQRQENSEKKLHWSQIFFVKFWGHACPAQDMHRIPRFVTFIFYFNIAYNPSMGQMRQCSKNFTEFFFQSTWSKQNLLMSILNYFDYFTVIIKISAKNIVLQEIFKNCLR